MPFTVKHLASFELLDHFFARDRESGYFLRHPVPGSHGGTFKAVASHHASDAKSVFWCDTGGETAGVKCVTLQGARPDTFEALDRGYSRTASSVYYQGRAIPGADPASFVADTVGTEGIDAKDAQHAYLQGRPAQPAAATIATEAAAR